MHLLLPSILTNRMNNDRANVHVGDNLITTCKRVRKQAVSNSTVANLLKIATELDYNHLGVTFSSPNPSKVIQCWNLISLSNSPILHQVEEKSFLTSPRGHLPTHENTTHHESVYLLRERKQDQYLESIFYP